MTEIKIPVDEEVIEWLRSELDRIPEEASPMRSFVRKVVESWDRRGDAPRLMLSERPIMDSSKAVALRRPDVVAFVDENGVRFSALRTQIVNYEGIGAMIELAFGFSAPEKPDTVTSVVAPISLSQAEKAAAMIRRACKALSETPNHVG